MDPTDSMPPVAISAPKTRRRLSGLLGFWLATGTVLTVTTCVLRYQGRPWWCACGEPFLWAGNVQSSHNSQHLIDPYSFTHVLHGVALCAILAWSAPRISKLWRGWLTLVIESVWEIAENSNAIIERYRAATIALGYEGDSVINSLADIACSGLGFLIASRLSLRASVILFLAFELILLFWIGDNLTLNILMLLHPSETIKAWQLRP